MPRSFGGVWSPRACREMSRGFQLWDSLFWYGETGGDRGRPGCEVPGVVAASGRASASLGLARSGWTGALGHAVQRGAPSTPKQPARPGPEGQFAGQGERTRGRFAHRLPQLCSGRLPVLQHHRAFRQVQTTGCGLTAPSWDTARGDSCRRATPRSARGPQGRHGHRACGGAPDSSTHGQQRRSRSGQYLSTAPIGGDIHCSTEELTPSIREFEESQSLDQKREINICAELNLLSSCDLCMGSRFSGRADKVLENNEF